MMRYIWPHFALTLDEAAGTVTTVYSNGRWTGGEVVADDREHAQLLGITPLQHRLAHELAHHLVAEARGATSPVGGCRILYRSSRNIPQREVEASVDEWYVTAFTYLAFGRVMRDAGDYGALIDLQRAAVDVPALCARYRWLLDGVGRTGAIEVRAAVPLSTGSSQKPPLF